MPLTHQCVSWVSLDLCSAEDDDYGSPSGVQIMMNTQESKSTAGPLSAAAKTLSAGQVMALGKHGGEVHVLAGRVWLTSSGDLDDHVLEAGESFRVAAAGPTLVEAWDRGTPALFAWRPRSLTERTRDRVAGTWGRCWELMNPVSRFGMGAAAAAAAIVAAGLLFGPLSQARIRSLVRPAGAAVLHNAGGVAVGATETTRGSLADGSDTRDRSRRAAPEARRGAAGAA
jgi:Protein of unknown function (DUF2917)